MNEAKKRQQFIVLSVFQCSIFIHCFAYSQPTTGNGGNVQKRGDVKNDKKLLFYAIIDHLIDKDSLKNTTDIDFGRDGLNSRQILLLILFEWFRLK